MHDLSGDCIMMRRTSVCVQGLNDASDDDAVLDIGGGILYIAAYRFPKHIYLFNLPDCLEISVGLIMRL